MLTSNDKVLIKQLIEFGLSEKEARVYLALLNLEVAGVTEIAKESGVKRSSTYVVLEALKKKRLVGTVEDKKVQKFVAVSPDFLLSEAENRAKKAEEIKDKINNIIPELKALHKETRHKPIIKIFEGKEAVKNAYYNISLLKTGPDVNEIRVYEDPEGYINILPSDWLNKDISERKKLNIKMRSIFPETKEALEVIKRYKSVKSKDKFLLIPKNKFMSEKRFANMTICGDEVWFDSLRDGFCINIKKLEIANILKNLFDLVWEQAKILNKDIKN